MIDRGKIRVVKDHIRISRYHRSYPEYDDAARIIRRAEGIPVGIPSKSKDDIALLRFARENDAFVISNDRFDDHVGLMMRYGRGTRKWIQKRRIGFEFVPSSAVAEERAEGGGVTFALRQNPFHNRDARRLVAW